MQLLNLRAAWEPTRAEPRYRARLSGPLNKHARHRISHPDDNTPIQIAYVTYACAASTRRLFWGRASERQHTWLLNGVYRNLILISRRRFNLIKRHRVCEVSRASTFHECHRRAPVPVSVSVLIGDHVDYRWSMGKRDLLSGHFVVRVLTDLSASLSLSKNIALPPRGKSVRERWLPARRVALRRHVTVISQFACKNGHVKMYASFLPSHSQERAHLANTRSTQKNYSCLQLSLDKI